MTNINELYSNINIVNKRFESLMVYLRPDIYTHRKNQIDSFFKTCLLRRRYYETEYTSIELLAINKYLDKIIILEKKINDLLELMRLVNETNDVTLLPEISSYYQELNDDINNFEISTLFTAENDSLNAFLDIQAGAGGIDAQDWAEILFKMYTSWFEKKKFIYNILTVSYGELAGIKFISIKVIGQYAYGWLKNETGIHRLVRKSPFDANNKRHTSFASVFVYPENITKCNLILDDSEVKIDTFRSSGAGGQHVNKTDSAVRIIHIPTNITVQCQSERSQHKNKIIAFEQLKLKISALNTLIKPNTKDTINKSSITWGNQIRSYVFDKSYIKDIRIKQEINNINFILNGNLDIFILSILKLA